MLNGGIVASPSARRAFRSAWDHLVVEDRSTPSDAIFCFGSRYGRVPERAAALYHLGIAPLVLVTGGPPTPGAPPEAEIFAAALVAAGVPARCIVAEPHARHTGENVRLGMEVLRHRVDLRRITLVSWPLAGRRCRATFGHLHPEVEVASAPALRRPGHRWRPTTRRIRLALGELDRLDRYATQGLLVPQVRDPELERAVAVLRANVPSAHDAPLVEVEAPGPVGEAQDLSLLLGEG